ncbi:MAG: hypothetical protein ACLFPA_02445 [Dichotomicrobium sp.]
MFYPSPSSDRRYFDENSIPDDVWRVLRTASILSIAEFRVFEIAYHRWFGDFATEKTIERYFVPYMFEDRVPMWVRAFCSHVISKYNDDMLEPREFGIVPPSTSREQQVRGAEIAFWIVVGLVTLFLLSDAASQLLGTECMLPPCY